jgi:hypothetical protein
MAGFGLILGGAMSGWSDAKLDEIKAQREERLKELEAQRQDKRLADERDFRSKEADIGRNFESSQTDKTIAANSSENQKERDYRSTEAQKARDASGDLITGDDGTTYSRTGSTAKPLVDDQGKPIKAVSGKASDKPAEVSTAEWLIQQGVAPDAATAWKMVRSARNDPDKSRASIYKAWLDALTKGAMGSPDPVELEKQAREATDKTLTYLDAEPAASPTDAGQAGEAIPSDPAKRTVGKTYTNKNGQKAIWKGNGWEIVQ